MKTKEKKQISQSQILNPKSSSRRYPAEWETQCAVWLSWPHNEKEWGSKRLEKIRGFYIELISKILEFQDVNLIFANEDLLHEVSSNKQFVKAIPATGEARQGRHELPQQLKKIILPNNDIWIRDYGPFFMGRLDGKKKKQLIIDFEFNAWGGKFPPWDLDNNIPKEIAFYLACEIESYPLIMEGGALEFSGDGLILTTEQCLLNKNRNPTLNKTDIENILKSVFNIGEVIWLKRGLEGDHTDGHIDDVARFIDSRKILICKSNDTKDDNYKHLNESIEYLKKWKHPKEGYKLEIIELPMPDRMEIKNERLPNSYANFIFVNGGVIVPTFNCPSDKVAFEIFKKVFPDRKIAGIDCSLLIEEGGGLHCMTKQEPEV
jgi:agmatine deiminase